MTGTSIGFKNIASKIAYDLRLWLDTKPEPIHQKAKSLDDEDVRPKQQFQQPPKITSQAKGGDASSPFTINLIKKDKKKKKKKGVHNEGQVDGKKEEEEGDETKEVEQGKESTVNTGNDGDDAAGADDPDDANDGSDAKLNETNSGKSPSSTGTTSSNKSNSNRNSNSSNIKLGYNNIIASLLRTTTL